MTIFFASNFGWRYHPLPTGLCINFNSFNITPFMATLYPPKYKERLDKKKQDLANILNT